MTLKNIRYDVFNCSGQSLRGFVKSIHSPVGVEIGCETGRTTKFLLDCNPNLKLYTIDPYENYTDWNGAILNRMDTLYQETMELLVPYSNRFVHYREYSDDVVNMFEDDSLDFIFIDGLHTYDQVLKDCKNYYSKVKKNGLFSGHDYNAIVGVKKAVDEFATLVNKQIFTTEADAWFWYK